MSENSQLPSFNSQLSLRAPACFAGVRVDNLTQEETLDAIEHLMAQGGHHRMVVVNASKLILAKRDPQLRAILQSSDLVTADGMSVVWASRLSKSFGENLVERVTGIDTLTGLTARAARAGYRIFLLGAAAGVAEQAVDQLQTQHPGLQVVGCRSGYFSQEESQSIADAISQTSADILFLALGSPKQENWLAEFGRQTGVSFCLGVGGSFDHIAGHRKRAPLWMRKAGLEWLHRLLQEPRRLWRRYLIGNAEFAVFLVRELFHQGKKQE